MNFCTCGKLAYIQRLNTLGVLEHLCLEHLDQKSRDAIYGNYDIYDGENGETIFIPAKVD